MLEYIGKTKGVHAVVKKARSITVFLYKHTRLLELMRRKLGGKDLTRTGVTRFVISYLNIQSLYKNRKKLRKLFVSPEYNVIETRRGIWGEDLMYCLMKKNDP